MPDPAVIWKTYNIPIILGSLSLCCIVISLLLLVKPQQEPIIFSEDIKTQEMTVDVEGAVERPGVYTLPSGNRIEDAIVAAGGLTDEVDAQRMAVMINRAALLSDGMKLFIPKKNEFSQISPITPITLISINTALQSELEALPGVGPAIAKKIIDSRPYQSLEELIEKKAVGQSVFEKIKDQLTL